MRELLLAAGWRDIELADSPRRLTIGANGVDGAMQQLLNASVGRAVVPLLSEDSRDEAYAALRDELQQHTDGDVVTYDGAVWIVTARAGA